MATVAEAITCGWARASGREIQARGSIGTSWWLATYDPAKRDWIVVREVKWKPADPPFSDDEKQAILRVIHLEWRDAARLWNAIHHGARHWKSNHSHSY